MHFATDIDLKFQKRLKKRAYFLISIAAMLLFIGANLLTIDTLEKVGIWIFLTAIVFIHLGLKPYKSAKKRVFEPDQLKINEDEIVHLQNNKIVFSISFDNIQKIEYRNWKYQYGILITLKDLNKSYFLPYFTKSTFDTLLFLKKESSN